MKLTDATVRDLPLPENGNRLVYDDQLKGFAARVTAAGSRSFVIVYWNREGKQRRYTIGKHPAWTTTAARAEAKRLKQAVSRGEDPMAEIHAARTARKARMEVEAVHVETFAEAVADYIAREQRGRRQNATAGEVERVLLKACRSWQHLPVAEIGARDVRKLLEALRDGDDGNRPRPYLANRVFAYLRTFFAWCAEPGIEKLTASPMIGLRRPWEGEEHRERHYNNDELRALWQAAGTIGGTAGAFLKLLMLTGKRKALLAAMRWEEIDDNGLWSPTMGNKRKKSTKRRHAIPLPRLARQIIKSQRAAVDSSPYVFPGRRRGSTIDPGTPLQARIKAESGVADFFFHGCRHTLETRLAELGVAPHVRDMLLDHAPARGAGAGYDHHHYGPEMLDALERWAGHIEKLLTPAEVLPLRAATERRGAIGSPIAGGGEIARLPARR